MAQTNEPVSEEFFNLPPEVQEEILRRVPVKRLAPISRSSSALYAAASRPYLERLCAEPIQPIELQRYALTFPLIVGSHACYNGETTVECHTEMYVRRGTWSYNQMLTVSNIDPNNNNVIFEQGNYIRTYDEFRLALETSFNDELDLLSEYRIRSLRLGCVQRDPDYAKSMVLRKLDTIYKAPIRGLDDDIWVYQYLWMNSYAFNVYPPPRDDLFFPPHPTNELPEILNREIVRLYLAIRQELVKL
jgi:hypothetical protein